MELTINSRKLQKQITFRSVGSTHQYIYVDLDGGNLFQKTRRAEMVAEYTIIHSSGGIETVNAESLAAAKRVATTMLTRPNETVSVSCETGTWKRKSYELGCGGGDWAIGKWTHQGG